jgi:hypothetical protein
VKNEASPHVIVPSRCLRVAGTAAILASLAAVAGCASRPVSPPLQAYDQTAGYRAEAANLRPGTDATRAGARTGRNAAQ